MDADRSLSAALCSPSLGDQTDTDRGYLRKIGEDGETVQLLMKVLFPSVSLAYCASVFDIVTVEGEGCLVAGWEEVSGGARSG